MEPGLSNILYNFLKGAISSPFGLVAFSFSFLNTFSFPFTIQHFHIIDHNSSHPFFNIMLFCPNEITMIVWTIWTNWPCNLLLCVWFLRRSAHKSGFCPFSRFNLAQGFPPGCWLLPQTLYWLRQELFTLWLIIVFRPATIWFCWTHNQCSLSTWGPIIGLWCCSLQNLFGFYGL